MLKENDDDAPSIGGAFEAEGKSGWRIGGRRIHKMDTTDVANVVLFLAVFVGLWQLVTVLELWPKTLFPSPTQVAISISELIANNSLVIGIATTLWRLVAGFAISIAVG
ncbi:MAG: hypothetical protein M3243_05600, partial [Thermoproteota archaeon]|nr:hypothetical protein [Thermoproteota archaeon]